MNVASALIVASIAALAILAVRRVLKKGAPCECGCSKRTCGGGCCACRK